MNLRRHPRRSRLLAGDEHALLHAETCDRCADLLLADDEDQGREGLGREVTGLLLAALSPRQGFAERAQAQTLDRIGMQDLWDLVGDTFGGVADTARLLAQPDPAVEPDEER